MSHRKEKVRSKPKVSGEAKNNHVKFDSETFAVSRRGHYASMEQKVLVKALTLHPTAGINSKMQFQSLTDRLTYRYLDLLCLSKP
jgi:hypothetical protein